LKCDFFFNNIDEHDTNFFFANIKRIMPIGGKIIVNGSYHNNIALERFMRINGFTLKSERVIDAIKVSPRLLELFRSDPDLGLKFGDGNGMDHEKVVSWAKQNNIMQNFSEHAQFHAISLAFSRYIHRDGELNRFNLNPKLELTYTVFERVT
jgi:hypothetical protein